MDYEFQFAREQAIAIASDRVGHLPQRARKLLLGQVDRTLEQWKREQTQPDGTIVVESPPGDFPWLDSHGEELGDQPERIPAAELLPEQCAGPFVRSRSDLFTKLWRNNYAPTRTIASNPNTGHDVVMALLVEREGDSMPAESLASALLCIWTYVWASREAFRQMLSEKQAKQATQIADAQAKGVIANVEKARKLDQVIREKAIAIHLEEDFPDENTVAAKVYEQIKSYKEFKLYKKAGVLRRIKGTREAALRRVQRERQKSGNT
jgi:hypothetical protein